MHEPTGKKIAGGFTLKEKVLEEELVNTSLAHTQHYGQYESPGQAASGAKRKAT